MESPPIERAYAPPRAPLGGGDDHRLPGRGAGAIRTAAILLFIDAGLRALTWGAQSLWAWPPNWLGVVGVLLEAVVAACLLRLGPKLVWPTLVLVLILALRPLLRAYPAFQQVGFLVLIGPILYLALQLSPLALLLLGSPGRARRRLAVALFVVGQLLWTGAWLIQMQRAGERTERLVPPG